MTNKNLIPYIIYNNMYISNSKARDLYRSMFRQSNSDTLLDKPVNVKFESESDFNY